MEGAPVCRWRIDGIAVDVMPTDTEIVDEVRAEPEEVKASLSGSFRDFMLNRDFLDSLPGYLLPDPASQRRMPLLMERIRAVAEAA